MTTTTTKLQKRRDLICSYPLCPTAILAALSVTPPRWVIDGQWLLLALAGPQHKLCWGLNLEQ